MNPVLRAIMRTNQFKLRVVVIALMISIPMVLFTTSDYLTLKSLTMIENSIDFVIAVPGQDDLAQFRETMCEIENHEYVDTLVELMVVVVPELRVSSRGELLGNECVFVGINIHDDLYALSPAISSIFAQKENIVIGDELSLWNTQGTFNHSISIDSIITLSGDEQDVIQLISRLFPEHSQTQVQVFGSLDYILNLTQRILPQIGLSAPRSSRLAIWGELHDGVIVGYPDIVINRLQTIMVDVQNKLHSFGSVIVIRSPLTRIDEIRTVYTQLEQSLLVISIPAVLAAVVVTFTILWISLDLKANHMEMIRIRGLTKKSLQKYILLDGFIVGIIAGLLGVFLSIFLSAFVFWTTLGHLLEWFQYFMQNPAVMIGLAVVIGITTSIAANLIAITTSKSGSDKNRISKRYILALLPCFVVLTDFAFGIPGLRFIQGLTGIFGSTTLGLMLAVIVLLELVLMLASPLIIPFSFAKAFPHWIYVTRQFLQSLTKLPELVMKAFAAPSKRTSRLVCLTMIISFLFTPPIVLTATTNQMRTTDLELKIGAHIRVEVYGVNAAVCRTEIGSAVSSISFVDRVAWGTRLRIQTGLPLIMHDTDLILVDENYFNLNLVREYVPVFNEGIILSLSSTEHELVQEQLEIRIENVQKQVPNSGVFGFLPGFQETTFVFQGDTPFAVALSSYIETNFNNLTYGLSSVLLIEINSTANLNVVSALVENEIKGFTSDSGAFFMIEVLPDAEASDDIEDRFSLVAGVYLLATGILAMAFVITFNLRTSAMTSILLAYRGASRKQLLKGVLLEHVSVFTVPLLLGLFVSLIYIYDVTIVPVLIASSISVLPRGYSLVIPGSIFFVYILLLLTLITLVYFNVRKQLQSIPVVSTGFEKSSKLSFSL